jgi:hypothetical protein
MPESDNQSVQIDVNTDSLDDYNKLLYEAPRNVPKAAAPAEPKEEVAPAADTSANEENVEDDDELNQTMDDGPTDDGEKTPEEGGEGEDDDDILKPQPKKKQTVQDRINEITRQKHEQEREFTRRLAELEARLTAKQPEPTAAVPARNTFDPARPNPEALGQDGQLLYPLGEFDPQYIVALTEYAYDKKNAEVTASRAQQEQTAAKEKADLELATQWTAKLEKAEVDIPDLRPTIATLDAEFGGLEPTYGTYLAQTIMGLDNGPEVLFYLANNVDEARKIANSGPQAATLALGRLEARIQSALAKKTTPTPRLTNAPKPPTANRGNGGRTSVAGDTDDLAAFEKQFFATR